MNKKILSALYICLLVAIALTPIAINATSVGFSPGTVPTNISLTGMIGTVLNTVWVIVAAIAVIMVITAGVIMMTAAGSPDKVAMGRQTLIWAIIGLAIAILGFSVTTIVGFVTGTTTL